ncbi:hypothetical protein [Pseudonocardia sp.]|nr:hypothetical protein [Pseudonocardia sp.]
MGDRAAGTIEDGAAEVRPRGTGEVDHPETGSGLTAVRALRAPTVVEA